MTKGGIHQRFSLLSAFSVFLPLVSMSPGMASSDLQTSFTVAQVDPNFQSPPSTLQLQPFQPPNVLNQPPTIPNQPPAPNLSNAFGDLDPLPAWYKNNPAVLVHRDESLGLTITWKYSYVFLAPGNNAYYWYALVLYENSPKQGSAGSSLNLKCDGTALVVVGDKTAANGPKPVRENMSGTPNSGSVDSDDNVCKRYPGFRRVLHPGESLYDWAIFHNVPWNRGVQNAESSMVSLTWGPYGPSPAVYPWSSPMSYAPPPAQCPSELVKLGTCHVNQPQGTVPSGRVNGKPTKAQNLIVVVHGRCTDEHSVYDYYSHADQIVGAMLDSKPDSKNVSEVIMWDWNRYTPGNVPPSSIDSNLLKANAHLAWLHAGGSETECAASKSSCETPGVANTYGHQGEVLKNAVLCTTCAYNYVHLIGHSAGAKLIDDAAKKLAENWGKPAYPEKPFIHLTFLDAYTDDSGNRDATTYGSLPEYVGYYYSEHYVDNGLWYTDAKLTNAYNFDVTDWKPVNHDPNCSLLGQDCLDEKEKFGHQWPRWWYEKSITARWYQKSDGFRFGYPLSKEGGYLDFGMLSQTFTAGCSGKLTAVDKKLEEPPCAASTLPSAKIPNSGPIIIAR